MKRRTIVLASVLVISMAVPATLAQGEDEPPSQAQLLQAYNDLEPPEEAYPKIGVAHYLSVSFLQQPNLSPSDLAAASEALAAFRATINLTGTEAPGSFDEVPHQLQQYERVRATVDEVGQPGASERVWPTVQRLLDGALDRWGTELGDHVFLMARQAGEELDVSQQIEGYRMAAQVFETADAQARATAANMQADTLQARFEAELDRADDIRQKVESLASAPPSAVNVFGAVLWYQAASEAREDATTAASIYDSYGREEAREELETASASLGDVRGDLRGELITVLLPLHLLIGLLAAGVLALVQRYERDVREVMLGAEIALLRGVAE